MSSLKTLTRHTGFGDVTVKGMNDPENGELIVGTTYDYTRLLAGHKVVQDHLDDAGHNPDFWKVADIPAHVFDEALRNGALKDRKFWRAFVNNPDNARFVYERNGRKIRL